MAFERTRVNPLYSSA